MADARDPGPALVIRRVLPAPPEAVFAAWTHPTSLARWMAFAGAASARLDLRIGGSFEIVMDGPGKPVVITGEYLAIDSPTLLVFTWRSAHTGERPTLVTLLFRPCAGGTDLTLTHAQLPEDAVAPHRAGWGQMLDHLAGHLRDAAPAR